MKPSNFFRYLSGLLALSFLLTQTSMTLAEVPVALELSPELKTEFDRGLAAAKANDFTLAKSYFSKVQETALLYPPLLFNLGLTEAQAGNSLAAIAWFEAYLLLDPQADNRDQIRQEITRLDGDARTKAETIYAEAQKAAESIQGTDPSSRQSAFRYLAEVYTSGGNYEAAAKALANDPSVTDAAQMLKEYKNYELKNLALLEEIEAAEKIASEVDWTTTNTVVAAIAFEAAATAKLDQGDVIGGWALMRQIPAELRESYVWPFIDRFIKDKDFVPVEQLIQEAGEKAGEAIFGLAQHKIETGDLAGAKALAQYYASPVYKARFQLRLADLMMQKKDERAAKEIAEDVSANEGERSTDPSNEYWRDDFRVQIMGLKGDLDEAFAAAEVMPLSAFNPTNRAAAFGLIIQWAVLKGDEKKARKLLERAVAHPEGQRQQLIPYISYASALMIQGRLAEAETMLLNIEDGYSDITSRELMRFADYHLEKGDLAAAIEVLLKGEQLSYVVPAFTVKLAELLIKGGRFEKALDIAQKGYSKLQPKTRAYIGDAKQIEKLVRLRIQAEQEKKGADPRVIEWVLLARLLSDFFNVETDIKNVPNTWPGEKKKPELLVLDTALIARNIKNALFITENVRKGKRASCASLISSQELS